MGKCLLYLLLLFCVLNTRSQVILNAYAKVTAISVGATTFTVTNVDETNDNFIVGGKVIIMQMQDDVIGTNTTNIASFGDLGTIANAGNYEIGIISSRSPAVGTPTSITLVSALVSGYSTGTNSSLQIITLRDLGTNYSTTANITGLAWNGNVGGVIAILVTNTLTLNHSINANAIGFRGGGKNTPNGYSSCNSTTYINAIATRYAGKGEGIYKNTTSAFNGARGKILNGGGGGNDVNAGGGGGGNYTSGGSGGLGWTGGSGCSPGAGGIGGIALATSISPNRIFMGGGGGGGHENDGVGTVGGKGGGIILLKANTIFTSGSCAGISITANGATAANASNDGAGGSGAAGTIVLEVNSYSISSTCSLTISSNGGNGGNSVTGGGTHGGGGGGGEGVIMFSGAQPTLNITTTILPGSGGSSCASCPASENGIAGAGPNNIGILSLSSGPLPIELLNFDGEKQNAKVKLFWNTATETNNDYFDIEKSNNAIEFKSIGTIKGAGNSNSLKSYFIYDTKPHNGINYYRLKQVDFDGKYNYSQIVSVDYETDLNFSVYPNPVKQDGSLTIQLSKAYNTLFEINIYDAIGKLVYTSKTNTPNQSNILLNDIKLATGIYMVRLSNEFISNSVKLIVQ